MTGQTILDIVEDLDSELQLQSGEVDVAKALRALNAAQDMFETILATYPRVAASQVGTVTTTASQEYTTFPTGLLRLDALWYIDPGTSRPAWKVLPARETGTHAWGLSWVSSVASTSVTGKPRFYWTNGTRIYWDPLPNAVHTVRWYGFQMAADISAAGTFAYSDALAYPLATLAARILKVTLDDPPTEFVSLSREMFTPLIESMSGFNRDGATGMVYEYSHDT